MSGLTIDLLLDAADELAAAAASAAAAAVSPFSSSSDVDDDAALPRPDLPLPPDYDPDAPLRLMKVCDDATTGRGWAAKSDLDVGTVLLVEKPLAMVMGWEEDEVEDAEGEDDDDDVEMGDDEEDEDDGPTGAVSTGLLAIRLAESIRSNPSLWVDGGPLSELFPRDPESAASLPPWSCRVPAVNDRLEDAIAALGKTAESEGEGEGMKHALAESDLEAMRRRLPLIVRYNCLAVETAGELFVHPGPGGHAALSGTAVYRHASLFNHSSRPNVSRWAVGDVVVFVTNRRVTGGEPLVISYVEHEVLCEDGKRRTAVLGMDFEDGDNDGGGSGSGGDGEDEDEDEDSPLMPVVDVEVQQELMSMSPFERLDAIDDLMKQAEGRGGGDDDDDDDDDAETGGSSSAPWFHCDAHQLRILRALTLDGMGRPRAALSEWEACLSFVDENLPPLDEGGVALRVQAALCAYAAAAAEERDGDIDGDGDEAVAVAREHAARALRDHGTLFGGGAARFRRRYRRELELRLRPEIKREDGTAGAVEALFPLR